MFKNCAVYTRQRTKTIEPRIFNTKKGCKKNDNMEGNVSFMYLALTVIIVTEILLLLLFYFIAIEILLLLLLFYLIVIKILLLFYLQAVLTPLVNLGSQPICPT